MKHRPTAPPGVHRGSEAPIQGMLRTMRCNHMQKKTTPGISEPYSRSRTTSAKTPIATAVAFLAELKLPPRAMRMMSITIANRSDTPLTARKMTTNVERYRADSYGARDLSAGACVLGTHWRPFHIQRPSGETWPGGVPCIATRAMVKPRYLKR